MRLADDAHDYATAEGAIKALERELTHTGRNCADVRWLVAVNSRGRFAAVVVPTDRDTQACIFMAMRGKVAVVK